MFVTLIAKIKSLSSFLDSFEVSVRFELIFSEELFYKKFEDFFSEYKPN